MCRYEMKWGQKKMKSDDSWLNEIPKEKQVRYAQLLALVRPPFFARSWLGLDRIYFAVFDWGSYI